MVTTSINQKRGLNRFSKLPDDRDPWAPNNLLISGANENKNTSLTPVGQATDKKLLKYTFLVDCDRSFLVCCLDHLILLQIFSGVARFMIVVFLFIFMSNSNCPNGIMLTVESIFIYSGGRMSYSSSDDVEDENLFLCETAFENGAAFVGAIEKCAGNVHTFLYRDDYIPIRCTTIEPYEQDVCLTFEKDVDGVVIEWKNLVGIGMPVSYLQIIPKHARPLKSIYGMLKKHLDLRSYSENARMSLKHSVGVQLVYNSDGWETWLGFIPKTELGIEYSSAILEKASFRAINELKVILQQKLRALIGKGIAKDTLAKNNLFDLSRLRILPDDQDHILKVFDEALKAINLSLMPSIRIILFTFRFGDKCHSPLQLPISKRMEVENITIHSGVNISASAPSLDIDLPVELFWSKEGIQEIVGKRGSMITAFSFSECGNYQSNLDGKMLHISPQLSSVCKYQDAIRFVQLYADLPHRYPAKRFHPVSAAIFLVDGIIKNRSALDRDACRYIQEMKNNFEQIVDAKCRLEFVMKLPSVPDVVDPQSLINETKLQNLLKEFPLLIPFCHEKFVSYLQMIGLYLTGKLETSLQSSRGTGEGKAVWHSFQHELAVEKLLFGHPLCHNSRLYSINLGPGVDYPSRSKSDANGFLSFQDPYCCCVDEFTHPPAYVYSNSEIVRSQMSKTFGVIDLINGSKTVLGARLVWIFLKDLYDIGNVYCTFAAFHLSLKADNEGGSRMKITGGTTVRTLVELIVTAKRAKYPMVISCLLAMLQLKGADIHESLAAGMRHWNLGYFPALRLYDSQKNAGLYWNWSFGFWVLLDTEQCPEDSSRMAKFLTPLVVNNLEILKLCYASSLRNKELPWIKICIDKLRELKLENKELVTVLTFVTCVARLMAGHYVDFYNLERLERSLPKPVTQRYLQSLQIQDKFLLKNFNKFRLWRIHHSLPFKIVNDSNPKSVNVTDNELRAERKSNVTQLEEVDQIEPIVNAIGHEDNEIVQECFGTKERKHIPTNCQKHWTPCEISILADVLDKHSDMNRKSMYEQYQLACSALGIPDRSFFAFKVKLDRYKAIGARSTKT